MTGRDEWNGCRYAAKPSPMYESYFLRANHPAKAQAFWIRYTIYHGRSLESEPEAELWLALFDDGKAIAGGHQSIPLSQTTWNQGQLNVRFPGDISLHASEAKGKLNIEGTTYEWSLEWKGEAAPMLMLSQGLYRGGFPKAKAVVPSPMVQFQGKISGGDVDWEISDWLGSQNHNWGSQHTDAYAWGQVMGFDNAPDASLECATARLKLGGMFWTPPLTVACLRVEGREYRFDSLLRAVRTRGAFEPGHWITQISNGQETLEVTMECDEDAIVSLPYRNPSGGMKTCLNSKVARAEVRLCMKNGEEMVLQTQHRAAFEVLKD